MRRLFFHTFPPPQITGGRGGIRLPAPDGR
jgi:hypothetical protein